MRTPPLWMKFPMDFSGIPVRHTLREAPPHDRLSPCIPLRRRAGGFFPRPAANAP